jgi:hypothetical protein
MRTATKTAVPAPPVTELAPKAAAPTWEHTCQANCDVKVFGNKMVITVDLSKDLGASKSGKTRTVGTTNGFLSIGSHPGVVLAMNVNKK